MRRYARILEIRKTLSEGRESVGSWMQLADSSVAEILGWAGYDWVAVDIEHGTTGSRVLPDLFRALELGGTLPLARVAEGTSKDCKAALWCRVLPGQCVRAILRRLPRWGSCGPSRRRHDRTYQCRFRLRQNSYP